MSAPSTILEWYDAASLLLRIALKRSSFRHITSTHRTHAQSHHFRFVGSAYLHMFQIHLRAAVETPERREILRLGITVDHKRDVGTRKTLAFKELAR